jgi:hypothetical protein
MAEITMAYLWEAIIDKVKACKDDRPFLFRLGKFWTDGSEFLFEDEDDAEYFADFLSILGFDSHTGYYDPDEDAHDNAIDEHTGWYYVDAD